MEKPIRICPECGSTNVAPCWDAETDTYGLYSCEDCEVMRDEKEFIPKGFKENGEIKKEALIQLRKEITLGGMNIHHFTNSFNIDPTQVSIFFDGYMDYLYELMEEQGFDTPEQCNKVWDNFDNDTNLIAWYNCHDEEPFTKFIF